MNPIVHLDADAFFASVEQAADPRLRGRPVAVGGERRGIITSASYEARGFGIHTPMPSAHARKLCPQLILLPGDYERYEQFSRWMFSYVYDFTPDVEITSIDEGYYVVSGPHHDPLYVARTVRQAIRQSLKITVSEGLASNKLVSQIASKLHKPAAFFHVAAGMERAFLRPLSTRWLPGVGPRTMGRFASAGLAHIGDVALTPVEVLALLVGSEASTLHQFAHGVDNRPLVRERKPKKSYSQQHTFDEDITEESLAEATLRRMADQLMAAIRQDRRLVRTLTVRIRYNDRAERQTSDSLLEPTDLETDIYSLLRPLLRRAWRRRVSLRLVGLKLSNLYRDTGRAELALDGEHQTYNAHRRLADAIAKLRGTYGNNAIMRRHDLVLGDGKRRNKSAWDSGNPTPRPRSPHSDPCPLLHVHSHYSFLDSTLSPETIVNLAVKYGLPAIALTDRGNLHGAVPFVSAARRAGIRSILGTEIDVDGRPLLLYVENQAGYANLCHLLTEKAFRSHDASALSGSGRLHGPKNESFQFSELSSKDWNGLIAVGADPRLAALFPGSFYMGTGTPRAMQAMATHQLPRVAVPPVHHAARGDARTWQILQSIRTLTLLNQPHPAKRAVEAHFRNPAEMTSALVHPELLANTWELAERCHFELAFGPPQFPPFHPADGSSSSGFLQARVFEGMRRKYGMSGPKKIRRQVEMELRLIHEVGYEDYFLIVWELLQDVKARGIPWLTRGSAADSLVCYCLEISSVCPVRFDLYFQRFLNRERMARNKLPDIDIDFPHTYRDQVIDLMFARFGREHTAVVGGFSTYQARSALADVAKVLGVADHEIRRLTKRFPCNSRAQTLNQSINTSAEHADLPWSEEPYATAIRLGAELNGMPRHAKMHPCGVVLSRQPMHTLTPCFRTPSGYPATHFNMDAVEHIGLVKIDILAQAGLSTIQDVTQGSNLGGKGPAAGSPEPKNDIEKNTRLPISSLAEVDASASALMPWRDPEVWQMIATGQARAVHHIESPSMVGLCRRTNVQDIDTLTAVVSVIRPGAANENQKERFTRRYQGLEKTTYPHPSLKHCLKSTFGLLVYEEQVLQVCEAFAGMPAGEADGLRRALGKKSGDLAHEISHHFVSHAKKAGRTHDEIEIVWKFILGFSGYAFCKAHSAAYALEAFASAWLKRYYPAPFMASVLSHGKGFYDPLVYVLECHRLGLQLLPPCINDPGPAFTVHGETIRVPATRTQHLTDRTIKQLLAEREQGAFASLADFYYRVTPSRKELEALLRTGAFDGFNESRTKTFWRIQWLIQTPSTEGTQRQLLTREDDMPHPGNHLREPEQSCRLRDEMELIGFPVSGHPLDLYPDIAWDTYCAVADLGDHMGKEVTCCGLVVQQRTIEQTTGEPMKFMTLADPTGLIETELFARTYRNHGLATIRYPVLEITATVSPFENGNGFTLRVHRAGRPRREREDAQSSL